jgi:hypothetical protein
MQEDFESKWSAMRAGLAETTSLTLASGRADHPAWFQDLSTNARTKEEFMRKNCQVRKQFCFCCVFKVVEFIGMGFRVSGDCLLFRSRVL